MHSGSNKKGSDLVKITFVLMKNHEERNLERKSLFVYLKRYITVHNQMKSGQGLNRVGTWRQELRQMPWRNEGYWRVSQSLLSIIFIEPRITIDSTTYNGMDLPIIHQLRKCLTAGFYICILSTGIASFHITLVCVKLT